MFSTIAAVLARRWIMRLQEKLEAVYREAHSVGPPISVFESGVRDPFSVTYTAKPPRGFAASTPFFRWGGLVVLLSAIFVASLDSFIVFVAVPSIRTGLGATFADIEFIVAGYTLTAAIGLIVSGRLGDRFGRRRMFMIGFTAFTIASGLCGAAQSPAILIVARLLQGCAASVLTPQVYALIRLAFTDARERAKAFAWMGVTIGVGAIAGQIVGGFIISADLWHLSWRPIFLINLPIGLLALVAAPFFVIESTAGVREPLDLVGALLSALGLGLLLYPLIEGREAGWPVWSYGMVATAVFIIGLFAAHQRQKTARKVFPLLNTDLFHDRTFTVGLVLILLFFATIAPLMLSFSYLAQIGFGRSPMMAALDFSPLALSFTATSLLAGRRTHHGARTLLVLGAALVALGCVAAWLVWMALAGPEPESLILPLVVMGAGQGLFMTPVLNSVLSAIPENHAGAASGVLTTIQRVGNALGVAVFEVPFFATLDHSRASGIQSPVAYMAAFTVVVLCIAATMLCVLLLFALLPSRAVAREGRRRGNA
jgi:EmrB/QacA subfamily drug resistance transporter